MYTNAVASFASGCWVSCLPHVVHASLVGQRSLGKDLDWNVITVFRRCWWNIGIFQGVWFFLVILQGQSVVTHKMFFCFVTRVKCCIQWCFRFFSAVVSILLYEMSKNLVVSNSMSPTGLWCLGRQKSRGVCWYVVALLGEFPCSAGRWPDGPSWLHWQ